MRKLVFFTCKTYRVGTSVRKLVVLCSVILFFVILAGMVVMRRSDERRDGLYIVCTTSIIADTVRAVAGDDAYVDSLMACGVDPHVYRASAGDVFKLSGADIIIYNGLHLEGKMADLLESLQQASAITSFISENQLLHSDCASVIDPHVWHDVAMWAQTINGIRDLLSAHDPRNAERYAARAHLYLQELHDLDAWVCAYMEHIPAEQRVLVTAHDAFQYFGRAYGIQVVGLQGVSTESDIGIHEIQQLARFIVDKKIPAIFVESSVPQRSIQALQNAVASRHWSVIIGEQLLSDALGEPQSDNATYIGMIRYNVHAIVSALTTMHTR